MIANGRVFVFKAWFTYHPLTKYFRFLKKSINMIYESSADFQPLKTDFWQINLNSKTVSKQNFWRHEKKNYKRVKLNHFRVNRRLPGPRKVRRVIYPSKKYNFWHGNFLEKKKKTVHWQPLLEELKKHWYILVDKCKRNSLN